MNNLAEIIVRIDDVGCSDRQTHQVIEAFVDSGIPLSCQVIPADLDPDGATILRELARLAEGRLELAQHGWRHVNHAGPESRKYEFGSARTRQEQEQDIQAGKRLLEMHLGNMTAPVFTPPHDRLDSNTLEALVALGFRVVAGGSRTFEGLKIPGKISAISCGIDASDRRHGKRSVRPLNELLLALERHANPRAGLVLHAAEIEDFQWCRELVAELRRLSDGGARFGLLAGIRDPHHTWETE